jgi:hypothetical protein
MKEITPPTVNIYDMASIFKAYEDADGVQFYNLFESINIDGDIDPSLYDEIYLSDAETWVDLSQRFYGTSYLWWTILLANNITNPFEESQPGKKIKILKPNIVSFILSQL